MKRFICLLLVVFTCLSLCACGSDDKKNSSSSASSSSTPENVSATSDVSDPVVEQKAKIVKVNSGVDALNIRSKASTDSKILGEVDAGDKFVLLVDDKSNGWYQIQYEGSIAYVYAEYVTVEEVPLSEANALGSSGSTSENSASSENSNSSSESSNSESSSESENSNSFSSSDEDAQT